MPNPIHPINKTDNRFLVEFHDSNNQVVGVCPLYVTGVNQIASGTQIRVARGSVADAFQVRDTPREVIDRLRNAYDLMECSFLASFMRNDMASLEDRLLGRLTADLAALGGKTVQEVKGTMRQLVREEVQNMAALDMASEPEKPAKPVKKAG